MRTRASTGPGNRPATHRSQIQGGTVKRVTSGLLGLTLAASLGYAYASPGNASSTSSVASSDRVDKKQDELPNPLEDKRRAMRETAISAVLNGDATPIQKNGSTVVKVGKGSSPEDAAAASNPDAKAPTAAEQADQYVELSQERS